MHFIFLLARIYPYWALPLAVLFYQLAIYFRRKNSGLQWVFFGAIAFCAVTTGLWIVFRGDLRSDIWVRSLFS
jgi:hypothetical protein